MVKVSVIIPVYNAEKYVKDALESVMAQSLTEIEILAVDDGSTDRTGEILEDYSQKDERIRVIHKKNTGYGNTMNVGMDHARGKYLAVLESDDRMLPDMLKISIRWLKPCRRNLPGGILFAFMKKMAGE